MGGNTCDRRGPSAWSGAARPNPGWAFRFRSLLVRRALRPCPRPLAAASDRRRRTLGCGSRSGDSPQLRLSWCRWTRRLRTAVAVWTAGPEDGCVTLRRDGGYDVGSDLSRDWGGFNVYVSDIARINMGGQWSQQPDLPLPRSRSQDATVPQPVHRQVLRRAARRRGRPMVHPGGRVYIANQGDGTPKRTGPNYAEPLQGGHLQRVSASTWESRTFSPR